MKVVIIGPAWPLRGGIANFNEALCRAFVKEGDEAEVVSFTLQYPKFLFPGKTQFDEGEGPSDLKIKPMINSVNPLNWGKVGRYVRQQKPDLVIIRFWLPFMGPALGTIARKIRKDKKIKLIAITDNVIPHESRAGDRAFTKYFVKPVQGFVAMSASVLDDLRTFRDTPYTRMLPHPVYDIFGDKLGKEAARKHLKLEADTPYVLFFGLVRKYKGLDILLEALADPRLAAMNVKLLVAGEFYDDPAEYEDSLNALGDRVLLRNEYIPNEDVKHYFCAADLVAQTYRTATQSGVTQIAYHFERPMLVTDVGGLAEIVPDGQVGYVTPVDAQKVADALVDFYEHKREVAFTEATAKEKERFGWPAFIKGVKGLASEISDH